METLNNHKNFSRNLTVVYVIRNGQIEKDLREIKGKLRKG